MQPWKLPAINTKTQNLISSAVDKKHFNLQLVSSQETTNSLAFLTGELVTLFSKNGNNNNKKVNLVICPENNTACFLANAFASQPQILSVLMLSVIKNKKVAEEFLSKEKLRKEQKVTAENSSEYLTLLRLAANSKGLASTDSSISSWVVITTVEALASRSRALLNQFDEDNKNKKSHADEISASLAALCDGCDLVCLPDVDKEFAEACQSMTSRLIYIKNNNNSSSAASAASPAASKTNKGAKQAATKTKTDDDEFHKITVPAATVSSFNFKAHSELLHEGHLAWHFDDEASTLLICGNNIPGFLKRLRTIHDTENENIENALSSALLGAWVSASAFTLHVRLAHIFRHLLDRSNSINSETGEIVGNEGATYLTLRVQASKAIAYVASKAEPLSSSTCNDVLYKAMFPRSINSAVNPNANVANPFLFRAITSFALGVAPNIVIDKLCAAWGVQNTIIAGTGACKQAKRKQGPMIHALRMRYATRYGDAEVGFIEFICHMLIDQSVKMAAVTVGEVRSWLLWDIFFAPIYGKLTRFLILVGLLKSSSSSSAATKEDSSATSKKHANKNAYSYDEELVENAPEDDKTLLVIPRMYKTSQLNTKDLPLHTAHERHEQRLHEAACEEILSTMPQKRVPMYIGDVGNLIGVWTKYNARYEGRLGVTLTEFLLTHPDKFRVVSNVVMRVKESNHDPVRINYNDIESGSDDDEDKFVNGVHRKALSKKARKEDEEIARTGGKKKYTTKSRKKAIKSARNRSRFDSNRKQLAQDAKVPGYNKPLAKKISGRGVKKNARSWKR